MVYELVVYGNYSSDQTVDLLKKLKDYGYINKLALSDENHYLIDGNNRAIRYSSEESGYVSADQFRY